MMAKKSHDHGHGHHHTGTVKITDGSGMLIPELPTNDQAAPFPLHGPEDRPVPVSEDSPMLPLKVRDSDMQFRAVGGSNSFSATYNLLTTAIGAGIIALPFKLAVAGLPLGLFLLVVVAVLTEASIQLLLRSSRSSGFWSYADIMTATYGALGRSLMRFCVILHAVGILVIYLTILGDIFSGSGEHTGILQDLAGGATWWTSRLAVLVVAAVIMVPLILFARPNALRHSSAISLLLALAFIGGTTAIAVLSFLNGSLKLDEMSLLPEHDNWNSLVRLGTLLPTFTLAFMCHQNVHPIYVELHPPRWGKMKGVARTSFVLVTLVYIVTAVASYALFGKDLVQDVLLNYDAKLHVQYGKWVALSIRLLYALYLLLVFPVTLDSMRSSIGAAFFPKSSLREVIDQNRIKFYTLTTTLLAGVVVASLFLPSIDFAFQVTGSLASATLAFTLPGMVALSSKEDAGAEGPARRLAWVLLAFGLLITGTGIAAGVFKVLSYL